MRTWDKETEGLELRMPFMPEDGYVSYQNPPDFTWTGIEGSEKYDIIVAADFELRDIRYAKYGTEYNFHNFDTVFETGKYFFWAVRCYKDGAVTEWSSPRSFRIHPSADEFPVPPIEDIMKNIGKGHPRLCTTAERLAEFRSLKDKNAEARRVYNTFIERAEELLIAGAVEGEPPFTPDENPVINQMNKMKLYGAVNKILNKTFTLAFSYLLSGDKRYAELGIKQLLETASWDMMGDTSYENQDQVHRAIAYMSAIAYDWLYDAMAEGERRAVVDMIRARTKVMDYLLPWLKDCPYDSHGWTAFGYIGIIAISLFGEIPECEEWLRQVIPQYTVILPPWSYQDGGWSQGTDYWQYSTGSNKVFMDILASSGIFDLYKKTWARNEYLWSLYAYPYGLHGSFGDQSNVTTPMACYSGETLYRDACYTKNGVAKWLAEQYGKLDAGAYHNYNVAKMADIKSVSPEGYPLAHHFRDIGWVVMTDSVTSPERISMTFKSSKYGSFNHSHADQNSFIIEAYGANLATKSGYCDAYHSKHDSGFTRKSHAHNTVTLSGSRGQRDDKMPASGRITAFLNGADLDLCAGDATPAYYGALGGFTRHIVYVRPDVFIVIDGLKTNGERDSFEWWLNALHDIELDGCRARLKESCAVLDAEVVYPSIANSRFINTFSGSDGEEYPADGRFKDANVQRRVYFETEKLTETKMVVAMGIHKDGEPEKRIASEKHDGYIKLTVEGETVVYVNLSCQNSTVKTADGIEFTGAAAVLNKRSAMLASGTSLVRDGVALIDFESPASAVVGASQIGIFTDCDNKLTLGAGNEFTGAVGKITDRDGIEASPAIGIDSLSIGKDTLTLDVRRGEYALKAVDSEQKN